MALAPMANVTDAAFRRIIAKYGKPDVLWTEFVSADGLMSKGREALLVDLMYSESERPIVAQLFSGNPEKMFEAAKLIKKLGFDGLDINMGCPDRSIEKSGAGAALIKNPRLAREIIRAAQEGVSYSPLSKGALPSSVGGMSIPVSVKTRLGYNRDILEEWLPELLTEQPAAVTIHARTRKEMSKVPARWSRIRDAVAIRDSLGSATLILGNGDVKDIANARVKAKETGSDGVMLGRAIFGNPWFFRRGSTSTMTRLSLVNRLNVMVEHSKLFEKLLGEHKNFAIMKKHFKAYVEGFDGAKELRTRLMEAENAAEIEKIVGRFLESGLK